MLTTNGNTLLSEALRGGNWNNGSNAGVFAVNLNNDRTNTNSNIGFRPALCFSKKARRVKATALAPVLNKKEGISTLREQRKTQIAGKVCGDHAAYQARQYKA